MGERARHEVDRNVKGREMLHTPIPPFPATRSPMSREATLIAEERLCGRRGLKRSEGMCPGFVVPLGRDFVENIRIWAVSRFGLHFEVVGEDECVAGRIFCELGINVNICLCGRWISRGCWKKRTVRSNLGKSRSWGDLDGHSLGEQ